MVLSYRGFEWKVMVTEMDSFHQSFPEEEHLL